MKYFLSCILILINGIVYAQTNFPAGVANTYTLSEKDGYNSFMYLPVTFAQDGSMYTIDYTGNVEIHGNNYSVSLDTLKKLNGLFSDFKIIDSSEVWALGLKYLAIIKNKTVTKTIKAPENTYGIVKTLNEHGVYFFSFLPSTVETWFFNGTDLKKLGTTNIALNTANGYILESINKEAYLLKSQNDSFYIYKFNAAAGIFNFSKSYKGISWIWNLIDENNFLATVINNGCKNSGLIKNGAVVKTYKTFNIGSNYSYSLYNNLSKDALYRNRGNQYYTASIDSNLTLKNTIPFICNDEINVANKNLSGNFYWGFTGNRILLISPFVKKYPALFNKSNSAAVFTVKEDSTGRIWAGSYQTNIAVIDKDRVTELQGNTFKMMNGGSYYNNHLYLIGEGNAGLLQYNMMGSAKQLHTSSTGFYTYIDKKKKYFYYTTCNQLGLWRSSTNSLESLKPDWNKIDSAKGNKINNILTITEDTAGRIWCGHSRTGVSVYNPATDKATTWLIEKKETDFGGFSSLTDQYGTVWIGSAKGLWYYNDYSKEASPKNCIPINHPLLNTSKLITALTIYNNWLVIAAYDKILLLDLKNFYSNKKVNIRYLNPYEAAFTSFTEQNTMLTAKDSSIWFSTSDILYQWDIKNWLALQTYKAKTSVVITGNTKEVSLKQNNSIYFEPGFNSFDIHVQYVSPDNMPRYTSAALIKNGDTIILPTPGLQNIYNIKNIAAGSYNFILDVFEIDGTTTRYVYPITIKKFLWQRWWFWALLSTAVSAVVFYLYNLKQKRRVAEERAKATAAELQSFKSEQEKKIANLQLVTLSSQFRPHFILNALNTIGAQMDDKPEAESVLSRLGESVNLIFNHAQQQKILHPFSSEWHLVENIIHIHRQMYLKQLKTNLPDTSIIDTCKNIAVPLGILQIPVENALLHGLSNKENGPWNLSITITEKENFIVVAITDNGVGRKKSATLSNFTKHGTGTKNLNEIIAIINTANNHKIAVSYTDDIYKEEGNYFGTSVSIEIPKQLNYGNE